jgi:quinolinate synthase
MSDIVCTSSNAVKIVESVPKDVPIIFAPDKNLGKYIISKTGRDMVLWDGSCVVHEAFSLDKLIEVHKLHPDAAIIAHPESETHILETASYIGSTAGMIDYVTTNPNNKFIVATEVGILHKMQQLVPHKILIPAPAKDDNTCACSECGYMKMNTLQKVYDCLLNESPEINISDDIRTKALVPIERMLELS